MLEKCVLTILELNLNQRSGHKKTKLNICHHMLTSSTQLQNRSFHVVERTTTSSKYQKMKNARAKILFFIVKCANFCGVFLAVFVKNSLLKRVRRDYFPCGPGSVAFQGMLGCEWNRSHYITGGH